MTGVCRLLHLACLGCLVSIHGAGAVSLLGISEIQGPGHRSPFDAQRVAARGIVTVVRSFGFFIQDPQGDAEVKTSDALFVYTRHAPAVAPGDEVVVEGVVEEYIPGGAGTANLSTTEIALPTRVATLSTGNPLPPAVVLGAGGRTLPTEVIDDDGLTGFDPASDGIDFFESLEGMRVEIPDALAVAPTNRFGEVYVLADAGAAATGMNRRGGITVRAGDLNPERLQIDDALLGGGLPAVATGDRLGEVRGVVDYRFGSFEVLATERFAREAGGLLPEASTLAGTPDQLSVATYNVKNLSPGDDAARFEGLARQIVKPLNQPDVIALQEIQDESGPLNDGVTDATGTWERIIAAVAAAGGPTYRFADVPPSDGRDGGRPGANIRVGFLYNPQRVGLASEVERLGENTATFANSRKPLLARFIFNGHELAVVNNHFTSKSGSSPLFGATQPAIDGGAARRVAQAGYLRELADSMLAGNPEALLLILGDLNALPFESPLSILTGSGDASLVSLAVEQLHPEERYSFLFDGNAQLLDHMLVSPALFSMSQPEFDIVHLNAEFQGALSDHDPLLARFLLPVPEPGSLITIALGLIAFCGMRGDRRAFARC